MQNFKLKLILVAIWDHGVSRLGPYRFMQSSLGQGCRDHPLSRRIIIKICDKTDFIPAARL